MSFRLLVCAVLVGAAWAQSLSAHAQPFESGYWIVSGDTLLGEIRLGIEAQNADGAAFRRDASSDTQVFGVADAEGYGVWGGREYRRGFFQIYARRDENGGIPNDRLAFARVVREGSADLLALDVSNGRTFYYLQTEADTPIGLFPPERSQSRRARNAYRQTLGAALYPCVEQIDGDLPFAEEAIATVVDAHNACKDPSYTVPETLVAAQRTPVRVQLEMGLGGTRSTLQRRQAPRTPLGYTDPTLAGVQTRAAAVLIPPAFGGRIQPFADIEYAHDIGGYINSKGYGYTLQSLSIVLAGLGVRYEIPVGVTRAHVGVALQSGTMLSRTVETGVRLADHPDALLLVDARNMMGGQYIEVGVRPVAAPFAVTARMQSTALGYDPLLQPYPLSGELYRLRSTSLGVVARF